MLSELVVANELYHWEYPIDFMKDLSVFWEVILNISVAEMFGVLFAGFVLLLNPFNFEVGLLDILRIYLVIFCISAMVFCVYYFIYYSHKYKKKLIKHISINSRGIVFNITPRTGLHTGEKSYTNYENVTKLVFSKGQHKLIYYDSYLKKCCCYIPDDIYSGVTKTILRHCNSTMEVVFKE